MGVGLHCQEGGVGPSATSGRGRSPRPVTGRGVPRPVSPGRGNSLQPKVICVIFSHPSLPFAPGGNIDFQDEVIEAIRNLPKSHSDSLEILMGSDSSQKIIASPVHIQSDELKSSVAPQSKLCSRVMDVENCDSSLSSEEFDFLRNKIDPSSVFELHLSRVGDRIRMPPPGYFTVYSAFFYLDFTLPPHLLLVDIIKEFGLCVSLLRTPSYIFEGFLYRFRELGLPLSVESFFTLFSVRKIANDSFFFFFPQNGCKLDGNASSKGPWKEIFFYAKDLDWGFATSWGEVSPVLNSSHDLHTSFIGQEECSLQDIQRYKVEREQSSDHDGRARPPCVEKGRREASLTPSSMTS
ncbi:UNVERIFIED_CONTAM: hypothetical protein Slati_1365700 [Sesamum latifolium]|uniref:Uncharacterized protein n=1 Tax=Sesamum latifolium TaxID=2727402 RepID=A0AAW2XJC4_9LAMI